MLSVDETVVVDTEPKTAIAQLEPVTTEPDQEEAQLTAEVDVLWQAHNDTNALRKHTAAELRQINLKLGERLHIVKQLLSKPGRSGQWNSFLRARKIARSSADRLIERFLEDNGGIAHVGAISTDDAIEKLLNSFVKKTRQLLPDSGDQYRFGCRYLKMLGMQIEEGDDWFTIHDPEWEPDEDEPYDGPCCDPNAYEPADGLSLAFDELEPKAGEYENYAPPAVPGNRKIQI